MTYDLYVQLVLALPVAHARQAKSAVIGADIAAGKTGPIEYYSLDKYDDAEALRVFEEALCRAALSRSSRR